MSSKLPQVYLARHGETTWTLSGQHTSYTDLPLTPRGEEDARALARRLSGLTFVRVLTSPLQRAQRTAELAGFGGVLEADPDLVEWNYGEYEGRRTADILKNRPSWLLFRDGCPGGESFESVGARADRVIARVRTLGDNVLMFGHSHFFRILTARWLGQPVQAGRYYVLSTGSLSVLSYEHTVEEPVVQLLNCG